MVGVTTAWLDGWRRVRHAPAILLGVFALTFAAAVPFAVVMRNALASHLSGSLEAATAAEGANWNWWQEFISQASGLGATFTPRIVGFAATLDSVSAILDARRETTALLGLLAGYLALWMWLQGGIIDRYARQRPTRAHGFASASGVFFFRFLRLGVMAVVVYWWLFAYVHPWLFDGRYTDLTRGLDSERVAFAWRAAATRCSGCWSWPSTSSSTTRASAWWWKTAAAPSPRWPPPCGSSCGGRAPWPACGWPTRWCSWWLAAVWALVAPGVVSSGPIMWLAFLAAQLFVLARLALKLQFLASQTSLFQASLAHARYVAAPVPRWPESPAVESVTYSGVQ